MSRVELGVCARSSSIDKQGNSVWTEGAAQESTCRELAPKPCDPLSFQADESQQTAQRNRGEQNMSLRTSRIPEDLRLLGLLLIVALLSSVAAAPVTVLVEILFTK